MFLKVQVALEGSLSLSAIRLEKHLAFATKKTL